MLSNIVQWLIEWNIVFAGFLGSLLAGLATGLGALPVLVLRKVPQKIIDSLLGFSAGVMLAASFFSLIIPALEIGGLYSVVPGFILGVLVIIIADDLIPHEHFIKGLEGEHLAKRLKRIWLFILAITLHNFPEGFAVGVSFGTGSVSEAISITVAIGLQNAPEGLAVAFALMSTLKYSRTYAFIIALLTGLVEPIAGLLGVVMTTLSNIILPYALAFAAGAMIYVVSDEIIPESHRLGHERYASIGLIIGFIIMMILDTLFK